MEHLPVACSLTPGALEARRSGLLAELIGRAASREGLLDGHRLRFGADDLPLVTRTIAAERQCCRFLRFTLTVEPDGGPVVLDLTGPPGTPEFLSALFDA